MSALSGNAKNRFPSLCICTYLLIHIFIHSSLVMEYFLSLINRDLQVFLVDMKINFFTFSLDKVLRLASNSPPSREWPWTCGLPLSPGVCYLAGVPLHHLCSAGDWTQGFLQCHLSTLPTELSLSPANLFVKVCWLCHFILDCTVCVSKFGWRCGSFVFMHVEPVFFHFFFSYSARWSSCWPGTPCVGWAGFVLRSPTFVSQV